MKICIIGAGWYGCHAACFLRSNGCDVDIVDREGIFAGASSKNQNRLHLGYHYPRSPETIAECILGHAKFIDTYGSCVTAFDRNYYFIHSQSKVSIDAFRRQFCGQSHSEIHTGMRTNMLEDIAFSVNEKFIDNIAAKRYMEDSIGQYLTLCDSPRIHQDTAIYVNDIQYDYVLNCTNNQYVPIPIPFNPIYETVCSLLYRIDFDQPTGLTIMDGPFFSIFPYDIDKKLYTITHVIHSILSKGPIISNPSIDSESVRHKIESEIFHVFPDLKGMCEYHGYFTSKKTKYDYETDDRSLRWFDSGRYLSFSGGKITGIFEMEPILLDKIINACKVNT